jgi:glycolate oxidase
MKYRPVTPVILDELISILGPKNVLTDKDKLENYSHDETSAREYGHMPEVVITPNNAQEIARVVNLANRELIPITPRGAGSG